MAIGSFGSTSPPRFDSGSRYAIGLPTVCHQSDPSFYLPVSLIGSVSVADAQFGPVEDTEPGRREHRCAGRRGSDAHKFSAERGAAQPCEPERAPVRSNSDGQETLMWSSMYRSDDRTSKSTSRHETFWVTTDTTGAIYVSHQCIKDSQTCAHLRSRSTGLPGKPHHVVTFTGPVALLHRVGQPFQILLEQRPVHVEGHLGRGVTQGPLHRLDRGP